MRPKGSQTELEERRLRAIELLETGVPTQAMAQMLGVSDRSVRRWCALFEAAGTAALKLKPAPGRPRKLSSLSEQELKEFLLRGAKAAGFASDSWTSSRIAHVIAERFGVRYHVDHVGRLLQTLGWTLPGLNREITAQPFNSTRAMAAAESARPSEAPIPWAAQPRSANDQIWLS